MTDKSYSPGLEGVIVKKSALSRIHVDSNRLILLGYDEYTKLDASLAARFPANGENR